MRRGCSAAEAALVRLMIKFRFDVVTAAAEVGLPATTLERTMSGPAVALALRNWHRHRRLPPPSAEARLGPHRRSEA